MTSPKKMMDAVLRGSSDRNIRYGDLCSLLDALGFEHRNKGSHRIYWRDDLEEIINLQPRSDGKAKPYQVKQVRQMITRYNLTVRP